MNPAPPRATTDELRDALAILADGRRPKRRRFVKVRTEAGLADCEIVVIRGRYALALLPSGKLVTIGKLPARRAR